MESPIVEKIRKLHALAERAGTEHEAAVAAARVAELCRKHQLELGAVLVEELEKEAATASITHRGSWRSYRSDLCRAVSVLLDVRHYRSRSGSYFCHWSFDITWYVTFYGLRANVEASIPTYEFFDKTVARMLKEAVKAGNVEKDGRSKNGFRLGCASRIRAEAQQFAAQAEKASRASREVQALVILADRLKDEFSKKMGLCSMRRRGTSPDWGAFGAGYDAAAGVDLHGARTKRLLND